MDMAFSPEDLKKIFPLLNSTEFKITSPFNRRYNCIAWAAGDNSQWWEPDPLGDYYWPSDIPRTYTIEAYRAAYEKLGYKEVAGDKTEFSLNTVALYAKNGDPKHAARYLGNGRWTSKLGRNVDIEHEIQGLDGDDYGLIEIILSKEK